MMNQRAHPYFSSFIPSKGTVPVGLTMHSIVRPTLRPIAALPR
jgi:hypothetical protein